MSYSEARALLPAGATSMRLKTDTLVVGTGPGGAACGNAIAKAGGKVMWVEEGWLWQPEQFIPRPSVAYKNLFQESNTRISEGNAAIPMPGGRGVGGGSLINSAICLRASQKVRKEWAGVGLDWVATPAFDAIYDEIERKIGVTKMTPEQVRGNSMIFKKGTEKLGWKGDYVSRNAPGCVGCGVCQLGCPSGGKASVDRNLVPEGLDAGADLLTGARVEKLLVEGGRCKGVEGVILAPGAKAPVGRFVIEAERVVVAGSAIGTPLLLWRSGGLANSSGQMGENLHIHPCTATVGVFDEDIRAWSGAAQGYYIDVEEEEMVIETATATPEIFFMMARRLIGVDLRIMNRMALCGVVLRDRSKGSVHLGDGGLAKVSYSLIDEDLHRLVKGLKMVCQVYEAAGARLLHSGVSGRAPVPTLAQAHAELDKPIAAENLMLYATHAQGTCRMGADPKTSVVRPDGRTHDVDGLYIADGSLLPTTLGVNPQLTIMALATHIGRGIAARG